MIQTAHSRELHAPGMHECTERFGYSLSLLYIQICANTRQIKDTTPPVVGAGSDC